jgi:hypothetical protein
MQFDLCSHQQHDTLKPFYFAYFHTVMKKFTLKTKTARLMAGAIPRNSCRSLLKRLQILALPREHVFLLMNFIVNNQEHFQNNSAVHSVNTRNKT